MSSASYGLEKKKIHGAKNIYYITLNWYKRCILFKCLIHINKVIIIHRKRSFVHKILYIIKKNHCKSTLRVLQVIKVHRNEWVELLCLLVRPSVIHNVKFGGNHSYILKRYLRYSMSVWNLMAIDYLSS